MVLVCAPSREAVVLLRAVVMFIYIYPALDNTCM